MAMSQPSEGYRLSPQQRHEWARKQRGEAGKTVCLVSVQGEIDSHRIKGALQQVVSRQEILRSSYELVAGMRMPVQVISASAELRWERRDLTALSTQEQEQVVSSVYELEKVSDIDYRTDPIVSAVMLSRDEKAADLIISIPAISADSSTLKNLLWHFASCYANSEQSIEEPMPYIKYAEWQNAIQEEEAEAARRYWNSKELGSLWRLKLPFERKSSTSCSVHSIDFHFTYTDRQIIRDAVARLRTTEDLLLQAVWQALLSRLTSQQEISFIKVCDGRHHPMLQRAFGLYARQVPLSCRIEPDMNISELIARITEALAETSEWEDYFDIEQIKQENGKDETSRVISYEYEEVGDAYHAGPLMLQIKRLSSDLVTSKLKLRCESTREQLRVELQYDEQVYSRDEIERLSGYLKEMTVGMSRGDRVEQVELVKEQERREQLQGLNNTMEQYDSGSSIQELIERQAQRASQKVAVVSGEHEISYDQLNRQANQLAHYLRRRGVAAEVPVGICVERSVEMVVGMLGILKAGAAYVPLDPDYPRERLATMLHDIKAPVIVTQQHLVRFLPDTGAEIICLDSDWNTLSQESDANPEIETLPANLAYILFTSGSTGRPKGVAVEHKQLLNYVQSVSKRLDFCPDASFTTFSTFAADLGYTVFYPSLCLGGILHILPQELLFDPEALADYFSANDIDCLKTVPSHLKALQTINPARIMPRLRLVLGGEPSSQEWAEGLTELRSGCDIYNHYGPTEGTVGVLTYKLDRSNGHHDSTYLPLGKPIGNTQIYILDSLSRPVPFGAAGELHIGGAALARGYIARPDLTAERFIPDPFNVESGARMYRTGDLARYLPDGNVEFLGRNDDQVKIRGYRIETGEIEAVLNQFPSVEGAAVLPKEDVAGEKRLVAYIASKQQPSPNANDIRGFLRESVPDHMVPASFVFMQALPLTANGKLDRKTLLALDETRPEMTRAYVAPRDVIEEVLARVWSELLRVERIGVHDNFFDLGGHSLLAMQVLSRLRLTFQVDLSLRALFEAFTVADLAVALVENESKPGQVEKIARALKKLESLSPEKVRAILEKRKAATEK